MSEHQTPIKTPKQLIIVIALSFLVPIIIILLLVNYVDFSNKNGAGTNSMDKASINQRIKPIASVNYKDPDAPIVYKTGEEVYKSLCITCHSTGAAGAPKFGDKLAWGERIGHGFDSLLHSLLNGKGAMPARAGSSSEDYSDYELSRALVYLVNSASANFSEPKQPMTNTSQLNNDIPSNTNASTSNNAEPVLSSQAQNNQNTANNNSQTSTQQAEAGSNNLQAGKKIYEQVCTVCHDPGLAGAPKISDKAAWSKRIASGKDSLYHSALNGKGAMPPKGGFSGTDDEVKSAVDYMVSASK